MTTTFRMIAGPLLFLSLILPACGAPPEDDAEQAEESLVTCIKGQPCNGPILPLPPPTSKPQRTYCCSYGTSTSIRRNKEGRQYVHEIKGWGCRNLNESKDKTCWGDIQVTCNGFHVESLAGGELTCADPY